MAVGRYAPSPTGQLHLGNLRTAVVAWLFARSAGSMFLMRVEDLDPSTRTGVFESGQLADLRALGVNWDGPVVRQSHRLEKYSDAIADLVRMGLTFECFCSRREVREAAQAAHGSLTHYPGTCRELSTAQLRHRRDSGRPSAVRFAGGDGTGEFVDMIAGPYEGRVDDVVIQRNDGTPAYNLAVVVDDADQGIELIVRGDDLLPSTPAQIAITKSLGGRVGDYAHVPLVLGPSGDRLAKRDGAVSLGELASHGVSARDVVGRIATSLGLATSAETLTLDDLIGRFEPSTIRWTAWRLDQTELFNAEADE